MRRNIYKQVSDWSASAAYSGFKAIELIFFPKLQSLFYKAVETWSTTEHSVMSFFLRKSQNFLPHLCSRLRVLLVPRTAQNSLILYCNKMYYYNRKRKIFLVAWQLKTGRLFSHIGYQVFNFRAAWFNPCTVEGNKNALGYQPHSNCNGKSTMGDFSKAVLLLFVSDVEMSLR